VSELELETLDAMRIFENIIEEGDCWIWQAGVNRDGHAQFRSLADGCARLVRRMVWRFCGNEIEPRQPLGSKCGDRRCVNPAHMYPSTLKALVRSAAARGAYSGLAHAAAIAAARRKSKVAKLTVDKAREIRESTEPGHVLAERYGVCKSVVNGIRAGRRWKDYTNPFNQLMRRAA